MKSNAVRSTFSVASAYPLGLQARLALALAIGASVALSPALAANHALVMTIGNYADPQANLPGIDLDAKLAMQIAAGMGVPAQNITHVTDTSLSASGIANALDALSARVQPGDGVFIYYSGHGGQISAGGGRKCTEGLVTHDMKLYRDDEMEQMLAKLASRAGRVLMMNDSCFSGGAATRGIGLAPEAVRGMAPKMWKAIPASSAGGYTCGQAVNQNSFRSLFEKPKPANILYVAAAADNEVAFATTEGSAATRAWMQCMTSARDIDNSGTLSGEEIQACAQKHLEDTKVRQTITVVGNAQMPLTLVAVAPSNIAPSAPSAPAASSSGAPTPPGSSDTRPSTPATSIATQNASPSDGTASRPVASPAPAPAAAPISAQAALNDIKNAASNAIKVTLTAKKARLKIGVDPLDFAVTTDKPGFLYILHVGSDGKTFDLLFPNTADKDNKVSAGTIELPRAQWAVKAGGPVGTSYLLAVVADRPRDFGAMLTGRMGPFAQTTATKPASRNLIVEAVGRDEPSPGFYGASAVIGIAEVK